MENVVSDEALDLARGKRVLVLWSSACGSDALQTVLTSLREAAGEVLLEHVERLSTGTYTFLDECECVGVLF